MRLSTCKASKFTLFCHRFLGCICYLFPAAGNKCPAFLLCSRRIASAFVKYPHMQQIAKAGGSVFLGSHRRIQNLRCRKRPDFEQRGCFHQRAGPWCAGRLPGSASGQCGFMRRDWCRCPGRPCAGWHPAVWRYFRQCGCRCRRLSGWSACF